jgi:hypothetical protein
LQAGVLQMKGALAASSRANPSETRHRDVSYGASRKECAGIEREPLIAISTSQECCITNPYHRSFTSPT